jgi:hypothetical protein
MIEAILIGILSVSLMISILVNLKLKRKINEFEFDRFMNNLNKELTSRTIEDHTIIERTLQ